jgi:hypothetical protein
VGDIKSGRARNWTEDEVAADVDASNDQVLKDLFLYVKTHSDEGDVVTEGVKQNASFGLHLRSSRGAKRRCIFSCPVPWRTVYIYLSAVDAMFSPSVADEFRHRLKAAVGESMDVSKPSPGITTAQLADRLDAFKTAVSWLVAQPR